MWFCICLSGLYPWYSLLVLLSSLDSCNFYKNSLYSRNSTGLQGNKCTLHESTSLILKNQIWSVNSSRFSHTFLFCSCGIVQDVNYPGMIHAGVSFDCETSCTWIIIPTISTCQVELAVTDKKGFSSVIYC